MSGRSDTKKASGNEISMTEIVERELAYRRILNTAEAAAFWGVSIPTWRRLYRKAAVPKPILLTTHKFGWTLGSLIKAQDAQAQRAA